MSVPIKLRFESLAATENQIYGLQNGKVYKYNVTSGYWEPLSDLWLADDSERSSEKTYNPDAIRKVWDVDNGVTVIPPRYNQSSIK